MKFNRGEWVESVQVGDVVQSRHDKDIPIVRILAIETGCRDHLSQSGVRFAYMDAGRTVWADSNWFDRFISDEP